MKKATAPLVCVKCMTYNHAHFIIEAMDGFCSQETNFAYVCCIVDDASTDGEQNIIINYLTNNFEVKNDSIARIDDTDNYTFHFARHNYNKNCYFAVFLLKFNHYKLGKDKQSYLKEWNNVKYTAFCEGDDYWTDSQKLQLQVDFLEKNPEFSLTCHRWREYDEEKGLWLEDKEAFLYKGVDGISFGLDYKVWLSKTLTLVVRTMALEEFYLRNAMRRDTIMVYFLLKKGNGWSLNRVMGVYRRHYGGITGKQSLLNNRLAIYNSSKYVYYLDKEKYSRKRYYRNYLYALVFTRGTLLFKEKPELLKILSVPLYVIKELFEFIEYRFLKTVSRK